MKKMPVRTVDHDIVLSHDDETAWKATSLPNAKGCAGIVSLERRFRSVEMAAGNSQKFGNLPTVTCMS